MYDGKEEFSAAITTDFIFQIITKNMAHHDFVCIITWWFGAKHEGHLNKLAMVHLLLKMFKSQQLFFVVHSNSAWFAQVIYISNASAVSIKATGQLAGNLHSKSFIIQNWINSWNLNDFLFCKNYKLIIWGKSTDC